MVTQAEVMAYVEEVRRTEERVESHPEQWEHRRRRWADRHTDHSPHVAETWRAYEEATGSRLGCD
jgi:hypothetical protein